MHNESHCQIISGDCAVIFHEKQQDGRSALVVWDFANGRHSHYSVRWLNTVSGNLVS